ncbi:MAG: phosphoribosylanthranilate isomerase, partial [Pseudohongiellaceae bacterium]
MNNKRTRIKICGIRSPQEALWAAELGVDAIGLVFYEPSPRHVDVRQAIQVTANLPPFISVVGLFVNADAGEVRRVQDSLSLDLLQFHGDEDPAYCADFAMPYMKALRVHTGLNVAAMVGNYHDASAILLDSWSREVAGGSGEQFDWNLIPPVARKQSLILAGGLHAGNVAEAIRQVNPYAVDVSSGVEAAPGVKSREKMQH